VIFYTLQVQYVYLHEVLADALSFGTQFVWSTQFEPMYMTLLQREDGQAKTRLEVQYDVGEAVLGLYFSVFV
jgi:hypothetical protein